MLDSKFTTLLLIVSSIVLGLTIYYLLNSPQTISVPSLDEHTEELKLKNTTVSQIKPLASINAFEEITQRPLFSSNRQPEKEQNIVIQGGISTPTRNTSLELAGIVLSDQESFALIKDKSKVKLQKMKLKESINGWRLIEIAAHSVKLESGVRQVTLKMIRKPDSSRNQKNQELRRSIKKQPLSQPPSQTSGGMKIPIMPNIGSRTSSERPEDLL